MILSGFTRVVLVDGCSRIGGEHHQRTITVEHHAGMKAVLAEVNEGKTLKIFLSDQEH